MNLRDIFIDFFATSLLILTQVLGDVLLNFSTPQPGHHNSEVHHENGSFIPVSYFVNGPLEGMDIYQVWMAIASSTNTCRSTLGASEFSRSKNASGLQSRVAIV